MRGVEAEQVARALDGVGSSAGAVQITLRRMQLNHSLIGSAALLVLCSFFAGCDGGTTAPTAAATKTAPAAPAKVRLQLNWVAEPEFGGMYAAQAEGMFAAEALDVELIQGGPGVPSPQLIASGKVEFGVVAGSQLLELREQGGDLVALFAVYQGNPMGVMVHEASPFMSLVDLWKSDSTVTYEQGLADFRFLDKEFPGGNLKVVPYSANLAQFASDPTLASQCFITSEPVTLDLKGIKTRVFMIGEAGFDPYNEVVVTRREYYESHKDQCAALVRALSKGWRAYLNAPKPVNEVMAKLNAGMSIEAMNRGADMQRKIVETDETKRLGLGCMRAERWQITIDQLVELGDLKTKPDPMTLFVWNQGDDIAR